MCHFIVGLPARDYYFYGRTSELDSILNQRWVWVCSQRRMGKTSLLRRIEKEYSKQNYLVLFCDLAQISEKKASGNELFKTIIRRERRKLSQFGITLDDFKENDYRDSYSELLEILYEKGIKVAFLWDEAERLIHIERNDHRFLENLRAQLIGYEHFRFVICSTQLLSNLYQNGGDCSSFIATFRWIPLSKLDKNQSLSLLRCDQTDGWKSPVSTTILNKAVLWSGGHPLILQELGDLISSKTDFEGKMVTQLILSKSVREICSNPILKKIIEDDFTKLSKSQQQILRLFSTNQENSIEFNRIKELTSFEKDELVDSITFLESFGYVFSEGKKVFLNFKFYPNLLPKGKTSSHSLQRNLARIRRTIFISYSHHDQKYFEFLWKSIEPLTRDHEIEIWHDEKINAGANWFEVIERALLHAWGAILIISPDFINSEFITNIEVPKLLTYAERKGCKIFCLYVRRSVVNHIFWEINGKKYFLTDFQGINSPKEPLSSLSEDKQDELIVKCAETLLH